MRLEALFPAAHLDFSPGQTQRQKKKRKKSLEFDRDFKYGWQNILFKYNNTMFKPYNFEDPQKRISLVLQENTSKSSMMHSSRRCKSSIIDIRLSIGNYRCFNLEPVVEGGIKSRPKQHSSNRDDPSSGQAWKRQRQGDAVSGRLPRLS